MIHFLEHLVSKNGIQPDEEHVKTVRALKDPRNLTELRRAIGVFHYVGWYIRHLAMMAKPFYILLKKDRAWTWDAAQKTAFQEMKNRLEQAPLLAHYDPDMLEGYQFCRENRRAQRKEPLRPTLMPERPWQRVATDLCDHDGKRYLVVSDYYSPWLEVLRMRGTASEQVVLGLKSVFVRFRTPDILVSDNGPHSTTVDFMDLCKQQDIEHVTFSLHNPQGNGHAERAVQEAKKILKRTLKPKWQNMKEVKKRNNVKKREQARYFDRRQVAMDLPRISLGDQVLVRTDNESPGSGRPWW